MAKEIFPGWLPLQMAKQYKFPLQFTGKGQTIAIISLGGEINMNELKEDFRALRVPMPNIKVVSVDPDSITSEQNSMPSGETHLDVEIIGSVCPQSEITIYRGAPPFGFAQTVNKAIADKNSVISISWGFPEWAADKITKSEEKRYFKKWVEECEAVFEHAKNEGITVCAAAGDGGSSGASFVKGELQLPPDRKAGVVYPASSQYILACGGTELLLKNGEAKETVWNNSRRGGGASGGGVSEWFDLPAWQSNAGINIPSVNTGKMGRVIPDVAGLAALRDWDFYQSGEVKPSGGTSAVAPLWASFIALINDARVESGKSQLGFINERLYDLAVQGGLFNDITVGDNKPTHDYPGYVATPGFDACSGWGTPIGPRLFQALTILE